MPVTVEDAVAPARTAHDVLEDTAVTAEDLRAAGRLRRS
jgi:hypothetical protein